MADLGLEAPVLEKNMSSASKVLDALGKASERTTWRSKRDECEGSEVGAGWLVFVYIHT